jgi:hypothetical protein
MRALSRRLNEPTVLPNVHRSRKPPSPEVLPRDLARPFADAP